MFQEGDEFARAKVIADTDFTPDKDKGKLDNNSYNKDDATNYINYNHMKLNEDLKNYYSGLIALRKRFAAFRRTNYEDISFFNADENPFALGYQLNYNEEVFIVLFNADMYKTQSFNLPEGKWNILADPGKAGIESLGVVEVGIVLEPSTGVVLKKN